MFDKLRTAFSSAAKSFSEKELKDKDIDEILFQLETSLLESDVALEVIDSIKFLISPYDQERIRSGLAIEMRI